MIQSTGKNDFKDNLFDQFRWSANTYQTANEINTYFRELGVFEKEIKGITAIGAMEYYSLGRWKDIAIDVLRDAGIVKHAERIRKKVTLSDGTVHLLGNCADLLKNASTPRIVTLYEPLLILFADGNVLELLPCAGKGLRIGFNTLPKEMRDGVNRYEFDIGDVFNEFITERHISMTTIISSSATITYSGKRRRKSIKRNDYRLHLSSGYLLLEEQQCCEYTLSFPHARNIKCGEIAAFGDNSFQEPILEGCHGGGSTNIYPVKGTGWDEFHIDTYNPHAISVPYTEPTLFISALKKYFDPELPINKKCSKGHYDGYYWNFYTKETMIKMINETLLKLEEVRTLPPSEQCRVLSCGYRGQTEEEMLRRIKEEINFTERFVERLRGMTLNTPGYNYISFMGP